MSSPDTDAQAELDALLPTDARDICIKYRNRNYMIKVLKSGDIIYSGKPLHAYDYVAYRVKDLVALAFFQIDLNVAKCHVILYRDMNYKNCARDNLIITRKDMYFRENFIWKKKMSIRATNVVSGKVMHDFPTLLSCTQNLLISVEDIKNMCDKGYTAISPTGVKYTLRLV